jgi:REP element-mobilizing transposase RayT
MPRKGRLVFPSAIYHVLNRGNYRRDLFAEDEARRAFETCLFAACRKSNWVLHAFVIMRNHFHLAIETPDANLVPGMQWLQGTFANRFNRFRNERGHLFQGRYKSLLVDAHGKTLGEVCDYIHLNPVAAHLTDIDHLAEFRWSSFWYLHRKQSRPAFLRPESALLRAKILTDDEPGWAAYAEHLVSFGKTFQDGSKRSSHQRRLERGWALGSEEFKQAMAERDRPDIVVRDNGADAADDVRQLQWSLILNRALGALGRSVSDAAAGRKSARWKLALATWMRETTQASRRWLTDKLNLGTPQALSHNLSTFTRLHRSTDPDYARLKALSSS